MYNIHIYVFISAYLFLDYLSFMMNMGVPISSGWKFLYLKETINTVAWLHHWESKGREVPVDWNLASLHFYGTQWRKLKCQGRKESVVPMNARQTSFKEKSKDVFIWFVSASFLVVKMSLGYWEFCHLRILSNRSELMIRTIEVQLCEQLIFSGRNFYNW